MCEHRSPQASYYISMWKKFTKFILKLRAGDRLELFREKRDYIIDNTKAFGTFHSKVASLFDVEPDVLCIHTVVEMTDRATSQRE